MASQPLLTETFTEPTGLLLPQPVANPPPPPASLCHQNIFVSHSKPQGRPAGFQLSVHSVHEQGWFRKALLGVPFCCLCFPPMVTVRSFCPISVKDNFVRGTPSQCPRQEIAQDFPLPTCQTPLLEPSRDKWGICFLVLSANPPSFLLELEKWRTLIFFLAPNHTHLSMIQQT